MAGTIVGVLALAAIIAFTVYKIMTHPARRIHPTYVQNFEMNRIEATPGRIDEVPTNFKLLKGT